MDFPVIAFIGAGNMASAVIAGLIKSDYPADNIIAANRGIEKLTALSDKFSIRCTQSNTEAAKSAEIILLCVKPFLIKEICEEISSQIDNKLIISIAAGKTISSIKQYLQKESYVIRAMPNTPCLLSKGAIGLYADLKIPGQYISFVDTLFKNIGQTVWLDSEQQVDVVTALSGSGPAYYFYLTEALIKAGIELGLDEDVSRKLANQTAEGAAAMMQNQPIQSAEDLRTSVTSPNGTTAAGIAVFDKNNLMSTIIDAVKSATKRGQDLSKEPK